MELSTIPHSFKLNTDVKSVYLFADSEEEHMAWRRRIREAVRILRVAANNARSDGSEQADAPIAAADEDTGRVKLSAAHTRHSFLYGACLVAFLSPIGGLIFVPVERNGLLLVYSAFSYRRSLYGFACIADDGGPACVLFTLFTCVCVSVQVCQVAGKRM